MLSCSDDPSDNIRTVEIGGLFSISGNWSTLGKASVVAMNIAIEDVNKYFGKTGSNIRLSGKISDTRLEPQTAVTELQKLVSKGNLRFIIGPQSSAEVKAIADLVAEKELIAVSQGSTASSMALPGDGIFRFCPGDAVEGLAMSRSFYNSGKRVLITLSRDDAGNKGLQASVGKNFAELGGLVDAIPPYSTTKTDFSDLIATVRAKLEVYIAANGTAKVGVYIASFEELAVLFAQAAYDPVLASVNWYGGDGVALSSAVLDYPDARNFAIATGFYAPVFGLPADTPAELDRLVAAIESEAGAVPDAYALAVYDAVWVIARTCALQQGIPGDYGALKDSFQFESDKYSGITGPVLLDENGDRKSGSFDYFGIREKGNGYEWALVGKSN